LEEFLLIFFRGKILQQEEKKRETVEEKQEKVETRRKNAMEIVKIYTNGGGGVFQTKIQTSAQC
jgi:hypothetical protein